MVMWWSLLWLSSSTCDGLVEVADFAALREAVTIQGEEVVLVADITIDETVFVNGSIAIVGCGHALQGSTQLLRVWSSVFFQGIEFRDGAALDSGGAVVVEGDVTVVFNRCMFSRNRAKQRGGAVAIAGPAVVDVVNSSFAANSAAVDATNMAGGAIFAVGSRLRIIDSSFYGNRADLGGAIRTDHTQVKIWRTLFQGNRAVDGGALSASGSVATVEQCTFNSSLASGSGGAISASDTALLVSNASFFGGEASEGGAIAVSDSGSVVGQRSHLRVDRCAFDSQRAASGAAIYIDAVRDQRLLFSIHLSTFKRSLGGGAVWANFVGDLVIEDVAFVSNTGGALIVQGGLSASSAPVARLVDVEFDDDDQASCDVSLETGILYANRVEGDELCVQDSFDHAWMANITYADLCNSSFSVVVQTNDAVSFDECSWLDAATEPPTAQNDDFFIDDDMLNAAVDTLGFGYDCLFATAPPSSTAAPSAAPSAMDDDSKSGSRRDASWIPSISAFGAFCALSLLCLLWNNRHHCECGEGASLDSLAASEDAVELARQRSDSDGGAGSTLI